MAAAAPDSPRPGKGRFAAGLLTDDIEVVRARFWRGLLDKLEVAFQPVVNIHSGFCLGYEAVVRHHGAGGFASVAAMLDTCEAQGHLVMLEQGLHRKAVARFLGMAHHGSATLFLNLAARSLANAAAVVADARAAAGTQPLAMVFEVPESSPLVTAGDLAALAAVFRQAGVDFALDHFGGRFASVQVVHHARPDMVKIEAGFLASLELSRKKTILSHMVTTAHMLGAVVVAHAVDGVADYHLFKGAGCDFVQGDVVQPPSLDPADLRLHYPHVEALAKGDRRHDRPDQNFIGDHMEALDPIRLDAPILAVFDRFRADKTATFFPVVDAAGRPQGIVRDRDLKDYAYSAYGKSLIANKSYGRTLRQFLTACPVADINAAAEKILEAFTADAPAEGIVIVRDGVYAGFLTAYSALKVITEKNLATARDQNPLSKLPGNNRIHQYLSEALAQTGRHVCVVYFDFDNFKPFNDTYGFRLGDRAIVMFAELLAKSVPHDGGFVGHVGGDDFFAAFEDLAPAAARQRVAEIVAQFSSDAESLYTEQARRDGFVVAKDREGHDKRYPLLGVSAALLDLPAGRAGRSPDEVGQMIADLKKAAKTAPDHMAVAEG